MRINDLSCRAALSSPTLTHSQIEMDGMFAAMSEQTRDWKSLLSMTFAAGAFRLSRLAFLENSSYLRNLSSLFALGVESAVYGQSHHFLSTLSGESVTPETWQSFLIRGLDFGILRVTGHLLPTRNPFLGNQIRANALVLTQALEEKTGLVSSAHATYLQRLVHASISDVSFQMGQSLFRFLSGGKVQRAEHLQEARLEILRHSQSPLAAALRLPAMASESSTQELSWPRELLPDRAAFFKLLQKQQDQRRFEGLLNYYREVTNNTTATQGQLDNAFLHWMGQGRPELQLRNHDLSARAFYLYIRSLAAERKGQVLEARLFQGTPDAVGNPISIHAEIYRPPKHPHGLPPQGLIFLLSGYGETVAMYQNVIDHFVDKNYAVLAVDQRGHGFSGHPLGVEAYMSSPREVIADLQSAVMALRQEAFLKDLNWFGFGFSQGGLLHTLLAQQNQGLYQGQFLVSPTHNLGKRFNFVLPSQLEAAGRNLNDYLGLDTTLRNRENPQGNLVPQNFVQFGRNPARESAQRWLERGLVPPYFIIKDASVFWIEAIRQAERQSQQASLNFPGFVVIGERDGNIAGAQALENTRRFFANPNEWIIAGKDHQLLLEGEGLPEQILQRADDFFGGVRADKP